MRKRTKVIGLALAALFAFSAFAAASAQGETWSVNNGGSFETLSGETNVKGTGGTSILWVGENRFIDCTSSHTTGKLKNEPGAKASHVKVVFTECMLFEQSTEVCEIDGHTASGTSPAGTIETEELKGEVVTNTGNSTAHIKLEPENANNLFVSIGISGEECALASPELKEVKGAVEGTLSPNVGEPTSSGTVTFPHPALSGSSLTYGESAAEFQGATAIEMEGGGEYKLEP